MSSGSAQDVEAKPKSVGGDPNAGHEYEEVLQIIGSANVLENV